MPNDATKFRVGKPLNPPKDYDMAGTYNWGGQLGATPLPPVVPVQRFKEAPLRNIFHHISDQLKVEVPNKDHFHAAKSIGGVYWVAHVVKVAGYRVLLRYEGAESDETRDFWMGLGCADIHPVGWCASQGKPLVPPKFITDQQSDWKQFLVRKLTGSRTMPPDWQDKLKRAISEEQHKFRVGMRLEFLDRDKSERVRPGIVHKVIGPRIEIDFSQPDQANPGKKKKGKKDEADENSMADEFWVHINSGLIFPVGWATRVGHPLYSSADYAAHCKRVVAADPDAEGSGGVYATDDARPGYFSIRPMSEFHQLAEDEKKDRAAKSPADRVKATLEPSRRELCQWKVGMKLEAMDIVSMKTIHVASVYKVLKHGYLIIRIDDDTDDDFLPFHSRSPYLFPINFCKTNGIDLQIPKGAGISGKEFSWPAYLKSTASVAAPAVFFDEDKYDSSAFEVGAQLEATDMAEPKIVAPAHIIERLGSRLLRLRFHGWDESFDQFQDFRSPDIFPLGWCELVGHKLELPKGDDGKEEDDEEEEEDDQPTKKSSKKG